MAYRKLQLSNFSSQNEKTIDKSKCNINPSKTNDDTLNDAIFQINYKVTNEPNNLLIFPTISTIKLDDYCMQQNNNCNQHRNQRLSLQLDTIQESLLISKPDKPENDALWKFKLRTRENHIQPRNKSNYQRSSEDDIITAAKQPSNLSNLVSRSESLWYTNLKKVETDSIESNDKIEESEDVENDDKNSVIRDEQYLEINDLESEADLMPSLDSEIMNEDSNKLTDVENSRSDSESPTDDLLEEVHRMVNKKLMDSHLSNEPKPPFINSIFSNIPPVIRFVREGESVSEISEGYKSMMKWRYSTMTPNVVKRVVKRSGFKLTNKPGPKWIGYFGSHMKSAGFKSLMEHQKINHMPGSFQIGRKDRLWRNVTLLGSKKNKSKEFNFLPKTYCLPADLKHLKEVWDDEESRRKAKWILKPPASARGIGIRVISKWSQIPKKRAALIQSYISRPFLINGSKFDLRVYVAVTSCDPLRIYVYREGLVRFASHKYSKSSKNIANKFIHLTNYSVNKKNSDYQSNEDHDKCQGHKWTLQTLWRHFEQDLNIDWKPIWKNIKDCVVKTIISVEAHINSNVKMFCTSKSCVYELLGFDVLLDHNLKPWVLEVNISPSLHSNSPLDVEVKSSLISDLFNLVGFQLFEMPEESTQSLRPPSCRSSFSVSSNPVSESRSVHSSNSSNSSPDKYICRTFSKQVSVSSLNKTKLRRRSSTKSVKQLTTCEVQCTVSDENETNLSANSNESLSSTIKKTQSPKATSSEPVIIDSSNLQQRGFHNRSLTQNEKAKHKFYIQKTIYENPVAANTITDKLMADDVRILIESIDEFNRTGNFELLFPVISEDLEAYMSYIFVISGCRYYNSLLIEFMKKYKIVDDNSSVDCQSKSNIINSDGLHLLEKYSNKFATSSSIDTLWSPPISKDLVRSKLTLRSSSSELSTNIPK